MHEELADFCLKYLQKLGAGYAEVRLEETSANSFLVKNGIAQMAAFDKGSGIGVRFLVLGKLGFLSTNHLEKEDVKKKLESAVRTVQKSSKAERIILSKDAANKATYTVKAKKPASSLSAKEKLNLLFDIEKEVASAKVKTSRYFSLSDTDTYKYLVNTEGSKIISTIPRINFSYFITLFNKGISSQRYWQYGKAAGYEAIDEWNLTGVIRSEVKATLENMKNGVKAPSGIMDVVVAPQVTGIMVHESAGHPYEADRILGREAAQAGESFIKKNMAGTSIGSDIVNVADDPTLEKSFGFYLYDDEGVRARRKMLIKKGTINEFMHNRSTATEMNVKSNGSARSVSYDRETIVRMSNTFLLPGDHSEEELIEGIQNGVYVRNFTEWNIDDVRLNQKYVGAEAYLIKNGKLAEPVKTPTIEITTPQLWKAVDAIAKNTEFHAGTCGKGEPMQGIPVYFGGPSFRLRNIRMK